MFSTLNHTLKGFVAGNLLAHIPVVILVALLCTLSKLSISFSRLGLRAWWQFSMMMYKFLMYDAFVCVGPTNCP